MFNVGERSREAFAGMTWAVFGQQTQPTGFSSSRRDLVAS